MTSFEITQIYNGCQCSSSWFCVKKLALGQIFLRILWFVPIKYNFIKPSTISVTQYRY